MADWWIFKGEGAPHNGIAALPEPMRSRAFDGAPLVPAQWAEDRSARAHLGIVDVHESLLLSETDLDLINAAIYWRRPLLVTGKPGSGKSSLAYAIARELSLGTVLQWGITSRSTLREGLYSYDALARLEETNLRRLEERGPAASNIGDYIRLGPLGSALLPHDRPRVLLIDEIDKSDIDLPNDLLHAFEDGEFEIEELVRLRDAGSLVPVGVTGGTQPVDVVAGRVRCSAFPIVVLTDNGEREFPAAFLRRCVRLRLEEPGAERLARIVAAHLGADVADASRDLIEAFLHKRSEGTVATDQLLGAVYLASAAALGTGDREELADLILAPLDPVR
ncbi:AAA family ATPase [Streptomyces sp. H39-S7]|uniref:AAA family ATPase n=1 Tax=Streptomyces sp. H39-S7 TaxID=3004357 RepID=UPI0022AF9DB5|nr:MoxR family ATPase [Streptomyces sp. H39-S7]MCZ4121078.1 MoxR family ATPase [Streptomyces sp. H39-S7]